MRVTPLLAVLAFSVSLEAQTCAGNVVVLQTPTSQGCPVGLQARHAGDGGLVNVSPAEKHQGQGYRISFLPGQGRGIAQAQITLHGLAGSHVIPAGDAAGPDATEKFSVSPSAGPNHFFHSTVYTGKLTGVQWVEVNEIRYADGTLWHASADAVCRVAPNGYLLVAGGK